jgi:hypothetical protein
MSYRFNSRGSDSCSYSIPNANLSTRDTLKLQDHMEEHHPEIELTVDLEKSQISFGWPNRSQLAEGDFDNMPETVKESGFGFSLGDKVDVVFLDDGSHMVGAFEDVKAYRNTLLLSAMERRPSSSSRQGTGRLRPSSRSLRQ